MIHNAYANDLATQAASGSGLIGGAIYFLLIFGVFYFMFIRPQKKRAAAHKETVSNLKVGQTVLTTSGLIGDLKKISDSDVVLELSKGNTVRVLKNSIAGPLAAFQQKKG